MFILLSNIIYWQYGQEINNFPIYTAPVNAFYYISDKTKMQTELKGSYYTICYGLKFKNFNSPSETSFSVWKFSSLLFSFHRNLPTDSSGILCAQEETLQTKECTHWWWILCEGTSPYVCECVQFSKVEWKNCLTSTTSWMDGKRVVNSYIRHTIDL